MRSQQALGRPGTPVIPPGWQQAHGAVAAKTMTATVDLRKPGSTTGFADRRTTYTPNAPYATDQAARVQAQTSRAVQPGEELQAEEGLQVAGYLVTLTLARDVTEEPATGDLVDVTASDDPLLTGRTLKVSDIARGSLRFERDLFCTLVDPLEVPAP
jgi:hypothetical protein